MRWDDAGLDRVGNEGIAEDTFLLQTYLHTYCLTHPHVPSVLETTAGKGAGSHVRGNRTCSRDEFVAKRIKSKQEQ